MSFEHATQSEYQFVTSDPYQELQQEIAHLDDTIGQIEANLASPYFYGGDRTEVLESREVFEKRRAEIIHKLSIQTLIATNTAA